jgi:hypothetical protein
MSYTIEISFDIFKQHNNYTELQNEALDMARDCGCETYYIDFEMENEYKHKRNHCVITFHFDTSNISSMLIFLQYAKNNKNLYIETIFCNDANNCLYASKNYLIQNVHKMSAKEYEYEIKQQRKKYSDTEKAILSIVSKNLL